MFSLDIIANDRCEFEKGGYRYVALEDKSTYKLKLSSSSNTISDVEVKIDGKSIGQWRIPENGSIIIERPVDKSKLFTFVRETSDIARSTGAIPGKFENGLIVATFKPKVFRLYSHTVSTASPEMYSDQPRSSKATMRRGSFRKPESTAGVTVLGGHSDQEFNSVSPLTHSEIDWDKVETISLRLTMAENCPKCRNRYPPRLDEGYESL